MQERQRLEGVWKEFQRWMPMEQIFRLSFLLAFAWYYGDRKVILSSSGAMTLDTLEKSLSDIQGYDVRVAIRRQAENVNWQMLEKQEVHRLLVEELDIFSEYYEHGGIPRKMFSILLDLAGTGGKYAVTPPDVRKLTADLLGGRKVRKLADLCCGGAGLGLELWDRLRQRNPEISFHGEDCDRDLCDMACLHYYAYGVPAGEIEEKDVLVIPDPGENQMYDMIMMDVPRGRNITEEFDYRDPRLPFFSKKKIYTDWIFIQDALYRLNRDGTAAVIVTAGALIRKNEEKLREQIIVNDWLEAVITLPNNLYPKDHTGTELLIFNKNKYRKGKTIFIDISRYCRQTGRNFSEISEEGIRLAEKAFWKFEEISEVSAVCDRKQIAGNGYSFKPIQYIRHEGEMEPGTGIRLGDIAQIVRGAQILKKEDQRDDGEAYFINIKDIQNNQVLYEQADRIIRQSSVCKEKFRIRQDDILLTSKGTVLKAAVIAEEPPESYISGNITLIRTDQKKYDPYVLFEYLISAQGQIALERIQSGTTIRILSNANLQELMVPDYKLISMKKIGEQLKKNQVTYYRDLREAEKRFTKEKNRLLEEMEDLR